MRLSPAGGRSPGRSGRGLCFQGDGWAAWEATGRHHPQEASPGLPAIWPSRGRPPTQDALQRRPAPPSPRPAKCLLCLLPPLG